MTSLFRTHALGAMLALGFCSLLDASSAQAANSEACAGGGFTVYLPNNQGTLSGTVKKKVDRKKLPSHGLAQVRGKYIEFDVDVSTLAVYHYTLTGAANALDMTGNTRTELFTRKEPQLGTTVLEKDDLDVELSDGGLTFLRRGSALKMRIQAKDCAQGGIFQMEPENEQGAATTFIHTLAAPGVFYFVNPYTSKMNFGNSDMIRGKDSPQVATKLAQSEYETTWSVASGGRMGGVLGEDAVESSPAASACVQDCQAQNRIHGSVPVTDPVYGN
ncbi:hypothetical protein [Melittangium boletus]|uniref:hypothetical protein n=1 Tax=Melittangium boletus TaxID=83453 RepID=UPI003DA1ED0E